MKPGASDVDDTCVVVHSLLAAICAAAALCYLWIGWCEFPFFPWNDVRLAPVFALRQGVNPYPLIGDGPLSTWIYGPIAIYVNLASTFAATPRAAIQIASLTNALLIVVPLAGILFTSWPSRNAVPTLKIAVLAISILLVPPTNFKFAVADHAAIALGLLSCWYLTRNQSPTKRHLVLSAMACVLAAWSKQIAVFLALGQLVYLTRYGGAKCAARYAGWLTALGGAALLIFAFCFGFQNLWLNLVDIPARLPWADWPARVTLRWLPIVAQIVVPFTIVSWLARKRERPSRDDHYERFYLVAVHAAIAMLPVGLAALFKVGGDMNVVHCWGYLLPALALFWGAKERWSEKSAMVRAVSIAVVAIAIHYPAFRYFPLRPYTDQFETAAKLLGKYPHSLWFPQHPVLTYFADRELWHAEDGISTRYLAGYRLPPEANFRQYLPPTLKGVVYFHTVESPDALQLLPSFRKKTQFYHWNVYQEVSSALP